MILFSHAGILANFNAVDLTGVVVSENVFARHIGIREGTLGAGHILTIDVDCHLVIGANYSAVTLSLAMVFNLCFLLTISTMRPCRSRLSIASRISLAESFSTVRFSSGLRCRTISLSLTVAIPCF